MTVEDTKQNVLDFAHVLMGKIVTPQLDAIDKGRVYTAILIEQLKAVVNNFVATNAYTQPAPVYGSSPSPSGNPENGTNAAESGEGTLSDIGLDGQASGVVEEVANV